MTSTTPGDAFLRGLLPLAGAVLVGGGTVVLAFLILPAAGIALAAALAAGLRAGAADHRTTDRQDRAGGRATAGEADRTGHRDARRPGRADRAGGGRHPAGRAGGAGERQSTRVAAGTARAAGIAAGLAVASMGAAVWLAAQFGVPAVVDGDLAPVLLAVIVLTPLALTDTVQAVGVAASTLRRSSAAVRRLFEVLDAPPVTAPAPAASGAAADRTGRAGDQPARGVCPLAGRRSRCADRYRPGAASPAAGSSCSANPDQGSRPCWRCCSAS